MKMEYDLKAMDQEIRSLEESAKRLKALGQGIETVERNAEAILTFAFILRRNITDLLE